MWCFLVVKFLCDWRWQIIKANCEWWSFGIVMLLYLSKTHNTFSKTLPFSFALKVIWIICVSTITCTEHWKNNLVQIYGGIWQQSQEALQYHWRGQWHLLKSYISTWNKISSCCRVPPSNLSFLYTIMTTYQTVW